MERTIRGGTHTQKSEASGPDNAGLGAAREVLHSAVVIRSWLLAPVCALLAACYPASDRGAQTDLDPDVGGGASPPAQCGTDTDCVAVGATCCDCPSYAVPVEENYGGCSDLPCEPATCPAVEAACVAGACQLRCQAVVTEQVCSHGFVRDALGCLLDRCETGADEFGEPECADDVDCSQVPADCCGCDLGGADTAVPADEVVAHHGNLACPPEPSCPGVDVCDPDALARCMAGVCVLSSSPGDGGSGACGTEQTGPCPAGEVCVLNDPEAADATALGVGVCRPA
jgi:hypothetical protein